ncbi:hypothetical protein [Microterricola viridarii]|uniref:Uncharacterized protein n=1 Tax=Microterricola viridarii TaxID=412690 RepID=A0A0Y0MQZ3_9MICO|nr:hypothetical protein [Microterricola viridarii]AMB58223.1 hypothetical protein AWU67_04455 [Microterricola viridarii]
MFLGSPDYDTLEADVRALIASAEGGAGTVPLIEKGASYGEFTTPWGATASAVAMTAQQRRAWAAQDASLQVELDDLSTAPLGTIVGSVSVSTPAGEQRSRLQLDRAIVDPGPGWRLMNPVPMIGALLASMK